MSEYEEEMLEAARMEREQREKQQAVCAVCGRRDWDGHTIYWDHHGFAWCERCSAKYDMVDSQFVSRCAWCERPYLPMEISETDEQWCGHCVRRARRPQNIGRQVVTMTKETP